MLFRSTLSLNGYITSPTRHMLDLSQKHTSEAIDPPLPLEKCYQRRIPENFRHFAMNAFETRHFSYEYIFYVTSSVFVYPVGASIDMVQVLSMEIAKSHSRRTASKSAASIWASLEMAKIKRQRQKLETKSGGISNISGLVLSGW